MASFYAELHVAGTVCRVVHCRFACQQPTAARGRVQAKVRYAPLELTVDVPQSDLLLDWATTPHKPLSGEVVFYDLARQTPYETIAFSTGECVRYTEHFASGAAGDGAYVCELTIAATSFELRAGGPAGTQAVAYLPDEASGAAVAKMPAVDKALAPVAPEYTLKEFEQTIWGADKVSPAIIEQSYKHFNAAKASASPTPHWAALENLIRSTSYINPKSGVAEPLNGGWPPANGGVNKRMVYPAPPDKYDRYQKEAKVDADGSPILSGTFTSPVSSAGPFDYEARALEGQETDYDLMYEITILKPLPFPGEEADIIPWHGHQGNGVQTRMLFPGKDPMTGTFPWDWQKLSDEGYVRITYKSSPNNKFWISPDGKTAKIRSV